MSDEEVLAQFGFHPLPFIEIDLMVGMPVSAK
jgi:hypothetical protein